GRGAGAPRRGDLRPHRPRGVDADGGRGSAEPRDGPAPPLRGRDGRAGPRQPGRLGGAGVASAGVDQHLHRDPGRGAGGRQRRRASPPRAPGDRSRRGGRAHTL
ncbi:MAG: hypothetical protein AVDCRST_MAG36-3131, partial [uncultured Nocardioidaceae bacterium]